MRSRHVRNRHQPPDPYADGDLLTWPGYLLRRCHQRSLEIFNEVVGAYDVTRQQTAVLMTLQRIPGATQQRLSDASGFDRNTLAEILNRLKAKGLIDRRRSARDSRAYEIHLTAKASALLVKLISGGAEVQRRIVAPLPPDMRDAFIKSMRILIGIESAPAGTSDTADRTSTGV